MSDTPKEIREYLETPHIALRDSRVALRWCVAEIDRLTAEVKSKVEFGHELADARDAAKADNARLREALERAKPSIAVMCSRELYDLVCAALEVAAPSSASESGAGEGVKT